MTPEQARALNAAAENIVSMAGAQERDWKVGTDGQTMMIRFDDEPKMIWYGDLVSACQKPVDAARNLYRALAESVVH